MKIFGSTNGNTELLLKLALEAVKAAAPPDSTISLVRITNVLVPKHYLNARASSPKTPSTLQPMTPPSSTTALRPRPIPDADAITFRRPIYTRVIPDSVELFQDKTLGLFVDSVIARHRKGGVAARFEKKRVAGLMAVGGALGSEWVGFGLPVIHQMFFPPSVKIADQIHVCGCWLTGRCCWRRRWSRRGSREGM